VPWTYGSPPDAIAYVWTTPLVAGATNKVLWVVDGSPNSFVVIGTPQGEAEPVVSVLGGPSTLDLPVPGCWSFTMRWLEGESTKTSTVTLNVQSTDSSRGLSNRRDQA
jgi:hypothetical protein